MDGPGRHDQRERSTMTDQPGPDDPTPASSTPPPDDVPWWSRPTGETLGRAGAYAVERP